MIKYIVYCFSGLLLSQTLYQGPINFSYSGSENGDFSSAIDDTSNLGGAINVVMNDSSSFMMMGISPQDENVFDLFVTILQDTVFPVQPRTWEWSVSIGDLTEIIDNPLSFPTLTIFIPGLDSTFANQWLSFFTDTSNINDSSSFDSLSTSFFEDLIDDMYISTEGNIEISEISEEGIIGSFNCTMWKPLFSFTTINNAEFHFIPINIENLSTISNFVIPNTVTFHRAFPNPFNPFLKIPYSVDIGQNIHISVYNIKGRQIENLVSHYHAPGNYMTSFYGNNISSGIYFVTLKHKDGIQTQKIVYTK
tara:strand:- start:278 stop:1198 length:921 start_codon:yes stop_codon:yes gene_type:complete